MRRGRASRTAQFVAYNRALASIEPQVAGFTDPVAELMLPSRWAGRVILHRRRHQGRRRASAYPRWLRGVAALIQFRTVVLDEAIAAAPPFEQLVVLGAGFDGRAWRLPRLAQAVVFEVDHPDTQAEKRARTAQLTPVAREVRYVPVDFTREELAKRLEQAGHSPEKRTFWLWEGVAVYLSRDDVGGVLSTVSALSAPGSTLAMTYHVPRHGYLPRSVFLRAIGEPIRSAFLPAEIEALSATAGWTRVGDSGVAEWKEQLVPGVRLRKHRTGLLRCERVYVGRKAPG